MLGNLADVERRPSFCKGVFTQPRPISDVSNAAHKTSPRTCPSVHGKGPPNSTVLSIAILYVGLLYDFYDFTCPVIDDYAVIIYHGVGICLVIWDSSNLDSRRQWAADNDLFLNRHGWNAFALYVGVNLAGRFCGSANSTSDHTANNCADRASNNCSSNRATNGTGRGSRLTKTSCRGQNCRSNHDQNHLGFHCTAPVARTLGNLNPVDGFRCLGDFSPE